MKLKAVRFALLHFIILVTGTLTQNIVSMGYGIIWYNYVGKPQWDNSYWFEYATAEGVIGSFFATLILTAVWYFLTRLHISALIHRIISITLFAISWVYISLQESLSYIFEFGNTWTNREIIDEIVFANPTFTVSIIAVGVVIVQLLLPLPANIASVKQSR